MDNSRKDRIGEMSLIFLHIPKAAGTTLHSILNREYRSQGIFTINGRQVKKSVKEFMNLPYEQRAKIRLLKGHMSFGLHKLLPNPSVYITMLRDPVDRIISHYYFVLRTPQHRLYERVTSQNMSLEEYVSSGISTEVNNGQTRLLSGAGGGIGFGECSGELLELAVRNIRDHFAVVGFSERFDETLILMKRVIDWRHLPFYIKQNVTKERPSVEGIPRRTISTIEKYNELDCELYASAKRSFEETLTGYRLNKEFVKFVVLNRVYQTVWPSYRFLRSIPGRSSKFRNADDPPGRVPRMQNGKTA
ncbi:MAG: sulfotransferase family 2 domain-containing protein [Candidatus Latescibacteria bacterium]|nr:sulfotransferase family 2 domain-containing protein [Candidatus Latescibacterota bacterium]